MLLLFCLFHYITKGTFIAVRSDLTVAGHQFRPLLPLRTLVPVVEGGLVGRPAALLVAVPEGRQTHAFLQVRHPVHRQVDHAGQRTCRDQDREQLNQNNKNVSEADCLTGQEPDEQHHHPSRPGVQQALNQLPDGLFALAGDLVDKQQDLVRLSVCVMDIKALQWIKFNGSHDLNHKNTELHKN